MANPEHVEILKRGVSEWNQWREASPDIKPDLAGANLAKANFAEAILNGANLGRANLFGANLTKSQF